MLESGQSGRILADTGSILICKHFLGSYSVPNGRQRAQRATNSSHTPALGLQDQSHHTERDRDKPHYAAWIQKITYERENAQRKEKQGREAARILVQPEGGEGLREKLQ